MDNICRTTARAVRRHFFMVVADVTAELEGVCMQGQGDEAARALRRPAALFAERRRRAPAAIMKDEGLVAVCKVCFDAGEQPIG